MVSSSPSHERVRFPAWLGGAAAIALCFGAIALLQVPQLRELQQQSKTPAIEVLRRQMAAQRVQLEFLQKMPSFGFNNLIGNWAFLNFLQYFGDEAARQKTDYTLSPDFLEVTIQRDPYFMAAYAFLSTSTALYAGMPERSVALMEHGLTSLRPDFPPGSFYVWRSKAIDQLLFLGDSQGAAESFETAAEWAIQSGYPGSEGAAQVSRQTAAFLRANPDSRSAQVAAWGMVLENAPDDRTRQTAITRIRELGGNVTVTTQGRLQIVAPPD